MSRRILVTGAKGLLGRELCRQLGGHALATDVDALDLTHASEVRAQLIGLKPQLIVHCAAYTQVDRAEDEAERCWQVNVGATETLVEIAQTLGCPIVHLSTDYVFGEDASRCSPYGEDDHPSPLGVYARSKWASEQVVACWPHHWIVRSCGLFAHPSDQQSRSFFSTMLRLGRGGKSVCVVADQVCSPTYAPRLAEAILFLTGWGRSTAAPWGVYHIASRGAVSWYEFAAEIFRQAGLEVDLQAIDSSQYPGAACRPAYSVLETSRYHALGGPMMPSWREAVAQYFADAASAPPGLEGMPRCQ